MESLTFISTSVTCPLIWTLEGQLIIARIKTFEWYPYYEMSIFWYFVVSSGSISDCMIFFKRWSGSAKRWRSRAQGTAGWDCTYGMSDRDCIDLSRTYMETTCLVPVIETSPICLEILEPLPLTSHRQSILWPNQKIAQSACRALIRVARPARLVKLCYSQKIKYLPCMPFWFWRGPVVYIQ